MYLNWCRIFFVVCVDLLNNFVDLMEVWVDDFVNFMIKEMGKVIV